MTNAELEALLAEQVRYYRALAPEYEDHALPDVGPSAGNLVEALDPSVPLAMCWSSRRNLHRD